MLNSKRCPAFQVGHPLLFDLAILLLLLELGIASKAIRDTLLKLQARFSFDVTAIRRDSTSQRLIKDEEAGERPKPLMSWSSAN